MVTFVFVVVTLVLVIGALLASRRLHDRRRREATALAAAHHLAYSRTDPFRLLDDPAFALLGQGKGREVRHVLYGRRRGAQGTPIDVRAFELRTRDRSGRPRVWAGALVWAGGLWPHTAVAPVGVLDGGPVIEPAALAFDAPDFHDLFQVRGDDPEFAALLLDPELLLFVVERGQEAVVEVAGPWIFAALPMQEMGQLLSALDWAEQFRDRIPPEVWAAYGAID